MSKPEQFTLYLDTTNSAFDDAASEVARIIRRIADDIDSGNIHVGHTQSILDHNGNRVGGWKFHPDQYEPF